MFCKSLFLYFPENPTSIRLRHILSAYECELLVTYFSNLNSNRVFQHLIIFTPSTRNFFIKLQFYFCIVGVIDITAVEMAPLERVQKMTKIQKNSDINRANND